MMRTCTLIAMSLVFICCSNNNTTDIQPSEKTEKHTIPMGDAEVIISLPGEFFHVNGRDLCKHYDFYCNDTGWPENDSVFISTSDPRSHIIICMRDFGKGRDSAWFDTVPAFHALNTPIREQNRANYKDVPLLPLTEEHLDPKGNPYTFVMLFSRYNESDTLYHTPITNVYSGDADSVECELTFYTLHGKKLFCIKYYSLESFESFSYAAKHAVLESIEVHDKTKRR